MGNGHAAAQLEGPPMPDGIDYLWPMFLELNAGRTSSGFGPNPLTWGDLAAYQALYRIPFQADEITVLRAFDRAYLKANAPKSNR